MSAQRLSERSKRRIERDVGEPLSHAWAHGGYVMNFVTPDHRHGWWDKKTGEWGWATSSGGRCYTSCDELPPIRLGDQGPPPIPAPQDDASAALAKEPPTPEKPPTPGEILAAEEAFVEQVRDELPRATLADRARRRTPAELAKHDRRVSGTSATTLEGAWEQGFQACHDWLSECCGCSGRDPMPANPYRGA